MNYTLFRKWMREQRDLKNITQSQLSESIGISEESISKIENGKTKPRASTRRKIITALESLSLPEWAKSTPPESADHGIAADSAMN